MKSIKDILTEMGLPDEIIKDNPEIRETFGNSSDYFKIIRNYRLCYNEEMDIAFVLSKHLNCTNWGLYSGKGKLLKDTYYPTKIIVVFDNKDFYILNKK